MDGEAHVFDMASLVEEFQAGGEAFDFLIRKNEAMVGWMEGNSLVFVEFQ
jgi:hypothetical protein